MAGEKAITGRRRFSSLARYSGWALVVASALFLIIVGRSHWATLSETSLPTNAWLAISGLVVLYGAALLLTGAVWHSMLTFTGAGASTLKHSMRAHTSAQLAKYVPGNVFHFLGRHMIHRAVGADDKRLALSALLENLVLLLAAASVAAMCIALGGEGAYRDLAMIAGVGLFAGLAAILTGVRLKRLPLAPLLTGFAASLLFFTVMAGIVCAIAVLLGERLAWEVGGSGVAAWIAGFVVPGSPGGLGVREAAMVLLGGHTAKPEVLLLTALLFRVVTFGGDLVCAVLGRLLFRGQQSAHPNP